MPQTNVAGRARLSRFVEKIEAGRVLPIISDEVIGDLVLGGQRALVEHYAEWVGYPLNGGDELPRIAQHERITRNDLDDWDLKFEYLKAIKDRLYKLAEEKGVDEETIAETKGQDGGGKSVSDIADLLGFPRWMDDRDPLMVLANLPVPIYVTTSSHRFLEAALTRAGRTEHRTDYVRWQQLDSSEDDESVLANGFKPTVKEPLVYHLFGVDSNLDSLVLTEDDYLRYLIAVSGEKARDTDILPSQITTAFSTLSLAILGFRLRSWAFRVIFWGLINNAHNRKMGKINLVFRKAEEQEGLAAYLRQANPNLQVFPGDIVDFVGDLCADWKC